MPTPEPVEGRCGARLRQNRGYCNRAPINGTKRCRLHGGATPVAIAKNERRKDQEAAIREAARLVSARDIDPATALLETVQYTAGEVAYWRTKVNELADDQVAGMGVTKTETRVEKGQPTDLTTTEATTHIYVTQLRDATDRLAKYSALALRAGLEERRVRLAEQQGQLVAQAVRRILEDLQLTPEQQTLVGTVVPRALRAIAATQETP